MEMREVIEEASVTITEKQDVSYQVLEDDGVTPKLVDGEAVWKTRKEDVRIPVALHKGQVFAANHEYVKTWPHLFGEVSVTAAT